MIPEGETQRLRELHEYYVWQVNAAIAEGRDDLVAELADEFLDDAFAELTASRADDPTLVLPGLAPTQPTPVAPTGAGAWEVVDSRPGRSWWQRLLRR